MDAKSPTIDHIFISLGGCGTFQVAIVILASLCLVSLPFSTLLMWFGAHNPWKQCARNNSGTNILDGINHAQHNNTTHYFSAETEVLQVQENDSTKYSFSCYENTTSCKDYEFNSEVTTLVTEMGLVCDKEWVIPLLVSLQIAGTCIGLLISGNLGDAFGRKTVMCSNAGALLVLNVICVLIKDWKNFAVLRFFTGLFAGGLSILPMIHATEFVTPKWRSVVWNTPSWIVGAALFAVTASVSMSWRTVQIVNVLLSFVCLLLMLILPPSPRWLLVKKKQNETLRVIGKMAMWNNSKIPLDDYNKTIIASRNNQINNGKNYFVSSLFRRGILKTTCILATVSVFIGVFQSHIVHVMTLEFSPSNIACVPITESIANVLASIIPNIFGRRYSCVTFCASATLCFGIWGAVQLIRNPQGNAFDEALLSGVEVVTHVSTRTLGLIIMVYACELYPTERRGTAIGFIRFLSDIPACFYFYLAPKLAHALPLTKYSAMAIVSSAVIVALLFLPETRHKPLPENWNDLERRKKMHYGYERTLKSTDDERLEMVQLPSSLSLIQYSFT